MHWLLGTPYAHFLTFGTFLAEFHQVHLQNSERLLFCRSVGGYPSSVVSPGDPLAVTSKPGVQADVDGVQLIYTTATAAGPQSAPENEQSQTDQQLFHSTKF